MMIRAMDTLLDKVTQGDCLDMMRGLPAESIHFCMFSPPYWGLRDYGLNVNTIFGGDSKCEHEWGDKIIVEGETYSEINRGKGYAGGKQYNRSENPEMWKKVAHESNICSKCGAWRGQLGLEPTYQLYVQHMVEIGREVRRVLRKDGSWYLNLGDTYAGSGCGFGGEGDPKYPDARTGKISPRESDDVPAKCKLLIPYRVALALIDDGWTCRNDITWYKPNAMPSSVKDRLTCQTERIFHLVKSRTYYYDLDAIREPHSTATIKRVTQPTVFEQAGGAKQDMLNPITGAGGNYNRPAEMVKSIAKHILKRDIVPGQTRQSIGTHSGYFGPNGECHVDFERGKNPGDVIGDFWPVTTKPFAEAHFAVYPEALCERPIKSSCPPDGIVLDPMCGSGTTLVVAKRFGRHFMGFDLNLAYCEIARKRLARIEWPLDRKW